MARKGDLQAVTHLNIGLDNEMGKRLKEAAIRNERRLTQEARYALRLYLGMDATAAEDIAGV